MRNRQIGLVDIGLDPKFDVSMNFVQSVLHNINAGYQDHDGKASPTVDVDFVRSRDQRTIMSALTAPYSVLHVMAHGDHAEDEPTFWSSDASTEISLSQLASHLQDKGQGLQVGAVLADGCKTAVGVWKEAFRECLQGEVTYIGTTAYVGWYECTAFASAFYAALLRNRGRGVPPASQTLEAANRAARAYREITGKTCPYRAVTLTPSRAARTRFRV